MPPSVQTSRPAGPPIKPSKTPAPAPAAVPRLFDMLLALVVDLDYRPGCNFIVLRVPCFLQQVDNLFCPVLAHELECTVDISANGLAELLV